MAKIIALKAGEAYALKLSRLATQSDVIAKKAIHEGARVVADEIKTRLVSLPTEKFRYLQGDDKFVGMPERQKTDLVESFGISPISLDDAGNWNAKVGFDGYGSVKTKQYPDGIPNQLLARSAESGSSVREKTPFVRPGLKSAQAASIQAMNRTIDEEIEQIMK